MYGIKKNGPYPVSSKSIIYVCKYKSTPHWTGTLPKLSNTSATQQSWILRE